MGGGGVGWGVNDIFGSFVNGLLNVMVFLV